MEEHKLQYSAGLCVCEHVFLLNNGINEEAVHMNHIHTYPCSCVVFLLLDLTPSLSSTSKMAGFLFSMSLDDTQ